MVDQSELAWRLLSRSPLPPSLLSSSANSSNTPQTSTASSNLPLGAAHLTYTPMINARHFAMDSSSGGSDTKYTESNFNREFGEEGSEELLAGLDVSDRPLIVQFCANDPDQLLRAAKKVEGRCDAVDINLGCPQHIAKRGKYGSFLQEEWELIATMISTLHKNLSIPVTAKFRIFPDVNKTIEYAQMMEKAGASILTCHGRTREMKGHNTGLADWEQIRMVKQAVKVPVFANGNICYREDVDRCLEVTGADGVMTAEGNLSNPALFLPVDHPHAYPPSHILASRYIDIVTSLRTPTNSSAIKAHLFRMMHHVLERETDLRDRLGRLAGLDLDEAREIVEQVRKRTEKATTDEPITAFPPPSDSSTHLKRIPYWASQPVVRPLRIDVAVNTKGPHDAMTDLVEHGTGEERVVADDVESPSVQRPIQPKSAECVLCSNIAASQCSRHACLIHCRALGKTEVDPEYPQEQALKEAASGGLAGLGCEAHEDKCNKRKERRVEKKQNRQKGKRKIGDDVPLSPVVGKKQKMNVGVDG